MLRGLAIAGQIARRAASAGARVSAAVALLCGAARAQEFELLPEPVEKWCTACHTAPDPEGGFDIDALFQPGLSEPDELATHLELAVQRVRGRTMPPPDEAELPSDAERRDLIEALAALAPRTPGARVATMRRLTRRQYEASVEALFGLRWPAANLLPDDPTAHGFEGVGDVQNVSPLLIEKYLEAATAVATAVLADPVAAAAALGDADSAVAGVERGALRGLLRRAFRRPVDAEEVESVLESVAALDAQGMPRSAVRHAALRMVLVSPSFLFRTERGRPDARASLSAHEMATRLSFMLTSGPPDAALAARADDGSLLDATVLSAEALRLARLRDGRGVAEDFATQWLSLRDVLSQTADFRRFGAIWKSQLRPGLLEEAVQSFAFIVREDRSVLEVLDSDYTFVDAFLAQHYGITGVKGGEFRRVTLTDRRRGGILGTGAMLMATSYPLRTSPVKRGQWILTKLLDAPPPPPPPDAGTLPRDDKNDAGLTLREQLERHRAEPRCAACHTEMDALGFALENYDPLGRWRDAVHGKPVDAAATLPGGASLAGPGALKDALVARKDDFVRAFAKNLLVHGVGRDMLLADEPELAAIVERTRKGAYRFSALLDAVVTSPLFTMRDPDQPR